MYRSPWSNEYDPPLDDGTVPTPKLRKLEISANEAFDTYREMYAFYASADRAAVDIWVIGTTKEVYPLYTSGIWMMADSPASFS